MRSLCWFATFLNISIFFPGFSICVISFRDHTKRAGKLPFSDSFSAPKCRIYKGSLNDFIPGNPYKSCIYVWPDSTLPIPPINFCENSRLRGRRCPGGRLLEIYTAPPLRLYAEPTAHGKNLCGDHRPDFAGDPHVSPVK